MSTHSIFAKKSLPGRSVGCAVILMLGQLLYSQANEGAQPQRGSFQNNYPVPLSDLAKENLDRVAASSIQIREILVKDAGLIVELKRWVAKEASDNGQVVQESNLTDQAIFDRLDRDLMFRSVATALLQRYGYLLPLPNPDSPNAKEQDFILKERARRLVQIEAEEDAESVQLPKTDRNVERTGACDLQQDRACAESATRSSRSTRRRVERELRDTNPE